MLVYLDNCSLQRPLDDPWGLKSLRTLLWRAESSPVETAKGGGELPKL